MTEAVGAAPGEIPVAGAACRTWRGPSARSGPGSRRGGPAGTPARAARRSTASRADSRATGTGTPQNTTRPTPSTQTSTAPASMSCARVQRSLRPCANNRTIGAARIVPANDPRAPVHPDGRSRFTAPGLNAASVSVADRGAARDGGEHRQSGKPQCVLRRLQRMTAAGEPIHQVGEEQTLARVRQREDRTRPARRPTPSSSSSVAARRMTGQTL